MKRDDVVDLVDAAAAAVGLVEIERAVAIDDDVRDVASRERGVETTGGTRTEPDGATIDDQVAEAVMGIGERQCRVAGDADGTEASKLADEGRGGGLVDVQRRADAEVDVRPVGVGLAIATRDGADGLRIGGAELEVRQGDRIGVGRAVHRDTVGPVDGDDNRTRVDARCRDSHTRSETRGIRERDDLTADGRGGDDDGLIGLSRGGRDAQRKLGGAVDAEDGRTGHDARADDNLANRKTGSAGDSDGGREIRQGAAGEVEALEDGSIGKQREARGVLIREVDGGGIADGEGTTTSTRKLDASGLDLNGAGEVVGLTGGLEHQGALPCLGQSLRAIDQRSDCQALSGGVRVDDQLLIERAQSAAGDGGHRADLEVDEARTGRGGGRAESEAGTVRIDAGNGGARGDARTGDGGSDDHAGGAGDIDGGQTKRGGTRGEGRDRGTGRSRLQDAARDDLKETAVRNRDDGGASRIEADGQRRDDVAGRASVASRVGDVFTVTPKGDVVARRRVDARDIAADRGGEIGATSGVRDRRRSAQGAEQAGKEVVRRGGRDTVDGGLGARRQDEAHGAREALADRTEIQDEVLRRAGGERDGARSVGLLAQGDDTGHRIDGGDRRAGLDASARDGHTGEKTGGAGDGDVEGTGGDDRPIQRQGPGGDDADARIGAGIGVGRGGEDQASDILDNRRERATKEGDRAPAEFDRTERIESVRVVKRSLQGGDRSVVEQGRARVETIRERARQLVEPLHTERTATGLIPLAGGAATDDVRVNDEFGFARAEVEAAVDGDRALRVLHAYRGAVGAGDEGGLSIVMCVGRNGTADGQHAAGAEEDARLGIDGGGAAVEIKRADRLREPVEVEPAARVNAALDVRERPSGARRELLDAAADTNRAGIDILRAGPGRGRRHRQSDDGGAAGGEVGRAGADERTGPGRIDIGETDAEGRGRRARVDDTEAGK